MVWILFAQNSMGHPFQVSARRCMRCPISHCTPLHYPCAPPFMHSLIQWHLLPIVSVGLSLILVHLLLKRPNMNNPRCAVKKGHNHLKYSVDGQNLYMASKLQFIYARYTLQAKRQNYHTCQHMHVLVAVPTIHVRVITRYNQLTVSRRTTARARTHAVTIISLEKIGWLGIYVYKFPDYFQRRFISLENSYY